MEAEKCIAKKVYTLNVPLSVWSLAHGPHSCVYTEWCFGTILSNARLLCKIWTSDVSVKYLNIDCSKRRSYIRSDGTHLDYQLRTQPSNVTCCQANGRKSNTYFVFLIDIVQSERVWLNYAPFNCTPSCVLFPQSFAKALTLFQKRWLHETTIKRHVIQFRLEPCECRWQRLCEFFV